MEILWGWVFLIREVPLYSAGAKNEAIHRFQGLLPESQGQNLVLTVLCMPYSPTWLCRVRSTAVQALSPVPGTSRPPQGLTFLLFLGQFQVSPDLHNRRPLVQNCPAGNEQNSVFSHYTGHFPGERLDKIQAVPSSGMIWSKPQCGSGREEESGRFPPNSAPTCRANSSQIRQSRPDSNLCWIHFEANVFKRLVEVLRFQGTVAP